MKKLFATALITTLFASSANATLIAYAKMKDGGVLALGDTDVFCNFGKDALLIPSVKSVEKLKGCWTFQGSTITVSYYDGDVQVYPAVGFTFPTKKNGVTL